SPFLTILFQLMVITGAVQVLSDKKTKRTLIAGYLLIFIQNVLYIPIVFYVILNEEVHYVLLPIIRITMLLIFSLWSYIALKNLIGTGNYKKRKYGEGEDVFYQIENVSKGIRFFNYFSDFFLTVMLLGRIFQQLLGFVSFFGNNKPGFVYSGPSDLSIFIIFTSIQLAYYLLSDAVFKVTPGKAFTGTFVVDANGNPATTKQLIGRCFARLIPFDALSFLARTGWHDSVSGTTVVKQEDELNSPFIKPDADGVIRYTD
ncbi:MAG: RDD family protein, partial [Bacteroidia bacterium]